MAAPRWDTDFGAEGGLFRRLRAAAAETWSGYTWHPFVQRLSDGSLPLPAFRRYLIPDYLFLIHFARAKAGGGSGDYVALLAYLERGWHVQIQGDWNWKLDVYPGDSVPIIRRAEGGGRRPERLQPALPGLGRRSFSALPQAGAGRSAWGASCR